MKLTKQIKTELAKAYQCALAVSILDMKAPLRYINQYIAEDVSGYGTAVDEKVQSREDYRKMVMTGRKQSKGKFFKAKITTPYRPKFIDETTVQFRDEMIVQIGDEKNKHSLYLCFSTLFKYQHGKWQMIMFHGSMPDAASSGEDTFHIGEAEKKLKELEQVVAQRTADLQAKTRELEIEASLERVRAVTMGMNKPGDILDICKVFFNELQSLGFKDLRNTLINFWDDENGQLHDYDYSDFAGGNFAKLAYSSHPTFSAFQKKIRKAKDAFAKLVIDKDGLKSWRQRRRSSGEYKDPRLSKISALYYYFYSTGVGALGISSFSPISKDEVEVLKRFRNVFDMAYQRYTDIQKAEAQAREAQIEAALERVRSRTMAMHKTDELLEAAELVGRELSALGVTSMNVSYAFVDNDEKQASYYSVNPVDGKILSFPFVFPHTETKVMRSILSSWKKQEPFNRIELDEKATLKHQTWVGEHIQNLITKNNSGIPFSVAEFLAVSPKKAVIYTFNFKQGYLFNIGGERLTSEQEELVLRFTKVFEMTYRRFLDLKQAEEQTREAQIELGLERVRARAMAMQNSDELKELIGTVFTELTKLDLVLTRCLIMIYDAQSNASTWWMANSEAPTEPIGLFVKNHKLPPYAAYIKAWKERKNKWQYILEGKDKDDWDDFLFVETELSQLPDFVIAGMKAPDRVCLSASFNNFGCLNLATLEPLSEEHFDILLRFAKVFDLTYTRFNDLQKAEAQTREAKIEMALERVRSRSLAMHSSGELGEVVTVVLNNLLELGYIIDQGAAAHLAIFSEGTKDFFQWSADPSLPYPVRSFIPYTDLPILSEFWDAREKGHDFFANVYSFEEKNTWFNYAFEHSDLKYIPGELKKLLLESETYAHSIALEKNSAIIINSITGHQLSVHQIDILRRFSKVFEQAYIRFLDLQKAEAQAREAQIQLALERVRARTMAMQQSEELPEAANLLFQQIQSLGMPAWSTGYCTWNNEEKNAVTLWMSSEGVLQPPFTAPTTEDELFIEMRKGQEDGKTFHVVEMGGKKLEKHYQYMRTLPVVGEILDSIIEAGHPLPTFQIMHHAYFSKGFLLFITYEPVPDAHGIFKRFGKVFDQTYTRFLDLQKAETQARQAKIEAAMEKVRSRAMAMQKPHELVEVAKLLRKEMGLLGVEELETSSIYIHHEDTSKTECWYAIKDVQHPEKDLVSDHMIIDLDETAVGKQMLRFYHSGKKQVSIPMQGDARKEWINYCADHSKVLVGFYGDNIPDRTYHLYKFTNGYMGAASPGEISAESWDLLQRATSVFSLAYTRFSDLQQAEAQAREAKIEVALERVRSRSIGMQKSEELKEVIKVLYDQFVHLNINLDHAGFVVDYVPKGDWHFWIADKQEIPSKISHPYFDSVWAKQFDEAKEKGIDFFATHLNFEEKNKFYKELLSYVPGLPDVSKDFYLSCPGLAASTVLLENVGLYIENFSGTPYIEEDNTVLMRFGKVFQQTYTRFLDLQKAEAQAREAQIEAALERVRSRSMAMHKSEELADLSLELVKQVQALGVSTWFCAFNINDDDSKGSLEWGSNGEGTFPKYRTPREGIFLRYYEAGQRGETLLINEIGEEECPVHYEYLCSLPGVGDQLLKMKDKGIPFPVSQIDHVAFFKYGYIIFITYEAVPESHDIFKRFAKVFEQTYTRFLDLQKAEAQAKEAQIEASLERVRSKTMAMHNSQDVGITVMTMFDELVKLGVNKTIRCGIGILRDTTELELWTAYWGENENVSLTLGRVDTSTHPLLTGAANAWKNKKSTFSYELAGADLINYYTVLNEAPHYPFHIDIATLPSKLIHYDFYFSDGTVFAFAREPLSDELLQIFKRFAAVFGQTYRRYLDLLKAEANAREAQIESALEKVRSRTMAMQSSNELQETAAVLFNEFKKLGTEDIYQVTIGIYNEEEGLIDFRVTSWDGSGVQENRSFNLDMNEPTVLQPAVSAWKANKKSLVIDLSGEALEGWLNYRNKMSGITVSSNDTAGRRVISIAYYSKGHLSISTPVPVPAETLRTLERFAAVFDATYTRFLDLEKAEAQTREARIEASLERVRSKAMAMHNTQDLSDTIHVFYNELQLFSITPRRCGVGLLNKEDRTGELFTWNTTEDGHSLELVGKLKMEGHPVLNNVYEYWLSQTEYHPVLRGKEIPEYYHIIRPQMGFPQYSHDDIQYGYFFFFPEGGVYAWTTKEMLEEELKIYRRFTSVLSLTYKRYKDLQQAEALAKKAAEDLILLKEEKKRTEEALTELQSTQKQLIQSEKMASLGELTAGIAHEIQNPLNFVNNFSDVSKELLDEMKEAIEKGDTDEAKEIMNDLIQNLEKINHHGKRADGIVKGMLQHSRSSSGTKEPTDINALADEYLRLAYHGLRAKDKSFNATLKTDFDESIGKISMIPQDIGRVILNLITNAFYVVAEKKARNIEGYEPTVFVSTKKEANNILVSVRDNGNGIPPNVLDKIFQPFFTTKPTGQGTGLGLSLAYDIVKAHAGELKVETKEGEGSTFIIILPSN